MKNIAIFIDIKNNKLTSYSENLMEFVENWSVKFPDAKLYLYTLDEVSATNVQNPPISKAYAFKYEFHSLFACNQDINELTQHLKLNEISQIFCSKSNISDSIFSLLSGELQINIVSNIVDVRLIEEQIEFEIATFSGKARLKKKIQSTDFIGIFPKSFQGQDIPKLNPIESSISFEKIILNRKSNHIINKISKIEGIIPLNEAQIVVGAGRGLKDPANWEIIISLAKKINASTACSKPVSDLNWRPHHEHVGQTGVKIAPKLYIACGISGAIQHLAGVNGSRIIVVVNNDSEAPFFKHADYCIKGDLFDIVPRLTNLLNSI